MPDMLVKLYDLPSLTPVLKPLQARGITVRRVYPYEVRQVRDFITTNFSSGWADEACAAFSRLPISLFLAEQGRRCLGFAAYECTTRNFFGPEGVLDEYRGMGVGKALLLSCLYAMREMGYVYAIIGAAGPTDFYEKACGATVIEASSPGFYRHESIR